MNQDFATPPFTLNTARTQGDKNPINKQVFKKASPDRSSMPRRKPFAYLRPTKAFLNSISIQHVRTKMAALKTYHEHSTQNTHINITQEFEVRP